MKPGRELDALIAEKVMGLCPHYLEFGPNDDPFDDYTNWVCIHCKEVFRGLAFSQGYNHPKVRHYSTRIADAWLVVEKILDMDIDGAFQITETYAWLGEGPRQWQWKVGWNDYDTWKIYGIADTAPLAICLAALKAVKDKP